MNKINSQEKIIKWEPIQDLSKEYYIELITDDLNIFCINMLEVKNPKNGIKVIFKDSVEAYRSTDESFRSKLFFDLDKICENDVDSWTFFKVINSEYLKWLSSQSYGWIDSFNCIHFLFITYDFVLDVVANCEPEIIRYKK
jgi:hypothetical protein